MVEELRACGFAQNRFYPFRLGAENPYQALLALCDRFVVTSDSVSMMTDAFWTGRPVAILELPVIKVRPGGPMRRWRTRRGRRSGEDLPPDSLDRAYDWLVRMGWRSAGRNVPALVAELKAAGWVKGLGHPGAVEAVPREQLMRETDLMVARIRALMAP